MQYQRYCGDIVTDIRADTHNAADIPTSTSQRGIATKDFIRWLNYAQHELEQKISTLYPTIASATQEFSLSSTSNSYTITDNLFFDLRIKKVEYSKSGLVQDYVELYQKSDLERNNYPSEVPYAWIKYNNTVTLEPPPSVSSGKIRVTFQRTLDNVALRAGRIISINTSSSLLQTLNLDMTDDLIDELNAGEGSKIPFCISSPTGEVLAYNVYYVLYDEGAGGFNLTLPYQATPLSGKRLPAIGDFVTCGEYTTTHSKLPYVVESYLTEFVGRKAKRREVSLEEVQMFDAATERAARTVMQAYEVDASTAVKPIPWSSYGLNMMRIPGRGYGRY